MPQSFHEVRFPLRLSLSTSGGPMRRTDIVNLSNGRESRNQRWRDSRRSYDAGSAVRSLSDLYELVSFFEARSGQLYGFRFRDPVDYKSCGPLQQPGAADQWIGVGDGETGSFQLIKTYGDGAAAKSRKIEKPVADTVKVTVDAAVIPPSSYSVDETTGLVTFQSGNVPASGAEIFAGYEFDVPVRFDIDQININMSAFNAGHVPNVPLMEIRP
ncbi:DUF2460 domain-containing protein [Martelella mediterranea]|uniref:Uncharacterized protein (TIGR02217 family) n=1 Tax=Martelella mediterranea TaxID=293089 RepID=A0A4R3NU83_9HYPH|nr:DUF2460 domain-containing protein [Martelella mediterranea]TCT40979.1 uncharacterized protein (TIGR02217 family) [Martelella mediterranea]